MTTSTQRPALYFTAEEAAAKTLAAVTDLHPGSTMEQKLVLSRAYLTRMIQSGLFVITN